MTSKAAKAGTKSTYFPPVVAVLGHVDHGKTSLLDAIRKTNIAQKEHGGITQKIGASMVEITHDGIKRRITFIDTPGHEAFLKMRSHGVKAADIGLLVVSSIDGVMPQTRESIQLLKDTKTPFIVVLTKSDLVEKDEMKVKRDLAKEEVALEGMGGDVPCISVSAKTEKNIKELLELIILVFDMNQVEPRSEERAFEAVIIEAKIDVKVGPKATMVVKNGTVRVRDELTSDNIKAKVRTLIDDKGEHKQSASVGEAVEVLGFEKVPNIGGIVLHSDTKDQSLLPIADTVYPDTNLPSPSLHANDRPLSIILSADTVGSLEAIVNSLPKEVHILVQKTGEITEADVFLAKSTKSIIVGFNTKVRKEVVRIAGTERVLLKNYTLIYELIDEIKDVLEGKRLALVEKIFGTAKILASFPFDKTKVLGVIVLDGRIAKGDKVRLIRNEEVKGESIITSVRQGKNSISKMEKGQEAGIIISPILDFTIGDMLICHG